MCPTSAQWVFLVTLGNNTYRRKYAAEGKNFTWERKCREGRGRNWSAGGKRNFLSEI